jgi:hypothetical protein
VVQAVDQTRSEKVKMYMGMPKRKLAEMLINCNEILSKSAPPFFVECRKPVRKAVRQRKDEFCRHMDNIGGCCKTVGHKKCTCVIGGKLSPVA